MKIKIINGVKYEIETHDLNKRLSEIKIPKGWRLWKSSECWKFYEDKKLRKEMNLEDCWFFVFQPRENTTAVAGFVADSGWAGLNCGRDPAGTSPSLGVRFARDLKKVKKK